MKRIYLLITVLSSSTLALSQTLFVPNASTNGIANSTNGNVGIGTPTPASKLHIQNGSTDYTWTPINGTVGIFEGTNINRAFVTIVGKSTGQSELWFGDETTQNSGRIRYEHDTDNLEFWTNATNQMNIDNTGNVGIGITAPEMKLDIEGSISLRGETNPSSGSAIVMGWSIAGDFARIRSRDWSGAQWKRLDFQASEYTFREGNVGVGTPTPASKLHIQNGSTGYTWAPINGTVGIFEGTNINRAFVTIVGKSTGQSELWFGDETTQNSGRIRYEHDTDNLEFWTNATNQMNIDNTGNVGIGTTSPDEKLTVKGTIHTEEIRVDLNVPAPDYVFEKDYNLRSLKDTETYINKNKHLPEIPSAKEMEAHGVELGDMNMLLLKKIEELTLYTIAQQKLLNSQTEQLSQQKEFMDIQQKQLQLLQEQVNELKTNKK